MMRARFILPALVGTALLSGCSMFESAYDKAYDTVVYQIDVPQGNFVEQKQVDQLRVNMTKAQVQFVMGTPMLVDAFTPDTWYYIHRMDKGDGPTTQEKVVLTFKDNKLQTVAGDMKPSDQFNIPLDQENLTAAKTADVATPATGETAQPEATAN